MGNIFVEELRNKFSSDSFPNALGIKLIEVSEGRAVVEMEVKDEHLNLVGTTHGGAIFTLADTALGLASNSRGRISVALNVQINYIKATKTGTILTAVAVEEHLTRKTGVYSVRVTDEKGNLIAIATGTCYVLADKSQP